jgi:hypothetical protein
MDIRENNQWIAIILSLLGFLASIVGFGAIIWILKDQAVEITLPILLVASIVSLLAALSAMVAVFTTLRLSNREYALGLPQGTVRAVIAISLILIFMTTSTFLSGRLQETIMVSKNFPKEQLENFQERIISIEAKLADNGNEIYEVTLTKPVNDATIDFAKQILTTIGTLVVAIAGFYFGTRAVSPPQEEFHSSTPFISNIKPNEGRQGDTVSVTIYGRNFYAPREIKLIHERQEITAANKDMTWNSTTIRCAFAIPHDAKTEAWDLIVVNENGREDRESDTFNILPSDELS